MPRLNRTSIVLAAPLLLTAIAFGYMLPRVGTANAQSIWASGNSLVAESEADRIGGLLNAKDQSAPEAGETWYEYGHPMAPDAAGYDLFGFSVAVSGDTAVVGALAGNSPSAAASGAAYVFVRNGNVWSLQQKLTPLDVATDDRFGASVAVNGDTVVVGAYYDDSTSGADSGSAYIFQRNGTAWTQQQKLTASDASSGDFFGYSVSISGDTAFVGAKFDNTVAGAAAGSAYVFTRSGTAWTEQQKLTAADGAYGHQFGSSVTIDGVSAIIGAPTAGAAYVFTRESSGGWVAQQKLSPQPGSGGSFGRSISLDGGTAIVGASSNTGVQGRGGLAHVFVRSGTTWSLQQILNPPNGVFGFGISVSVSSDTAIIGSSTSSSTGSAYIFARSGSAWTLVQTLRASDEVAGDHFAWSVSIDGDAAFVGAHYDDTSGGLNAGSAYVFHRTSIPPPPTPTPSMTPTPSPTPTPVSVRTVSAVPTIAGRGGSVSVPIELYSEGNEIAMGFSINFNPAILGNPTVALGSGVPPGTTLTVNPNQASSGRVGVLVDSTASFAQSPPARQVVTLTFSVSPNAPIGSTPISFGSIPTGRNISDRFANTLTGAYVNGSVTIRPGFETDVAGGDGQVLANDVVLIRQYVAGILTPPSVEQCKRVDAAPVETYGDGQLSAGDVIAARLYSTGILQLALADGPGCGPGIEAYVASRAVIGGSLFGVKFGVNADEQGLMRLESGKDGSRVVVLESVAEVAAVGFGLRYDPALGQPVVSLGDLAEGAVLTVNDTVPGELRILIDSALPLAPGKKLRLLQISFKREPTINELIFYGSPSASDVSGNDVRIR